MSSSGEEVPRIGRGRATQYARTRRIEGLGRSLPVLRVSERGEPTPAGLWGRRTWFDVDGWPFLEVERFDRVGARGRRALLTLGTSYQ